MINLITFFADILSIISLHEEYQGLFLGDDSDPKTVVSTKAASQMFADGRIHTNICSKRVDAGV